MAAQTFSLRIEQDQLERIDESATRAGLTRTAYVLSWLPETYEPNTKPAPEPATTGRR
jgi:uncharacterized protein (DUF1778 family)